MRPELQAKLLQHLNKKKADKGFTLVELLVVIVIIGILTAIALPSFLNQTAKAKQTEAKQNVSTIIKAQQSLRTEQANFTESLDDLALGTLSSANASTTNYAYIIKSSDTKLDTTVQATSQDIALRSYSGATHVAADVTTSQIAWTSVICEALKPEAAALTVPTAPTAAGQPPTCAAAGKPVQ
jgi:type IV pilus assembly protein PilA